MINKNYKLERLELMCSFSELSQENWDEIDRFSRDDNSEVRMRVAETLGCHHSEDSERRLLLMLRDADDLVRTEACDSLSFSIKTDTINALTNLYINDTSEMVKGYAVLSIGDIHHNICKNIEEQLKNVLINNLDSSSDWLMAAVYRTLILNGYKNYFSCLIEKLESKNYVDRIFAVSCFSDLIFCIDSDELQCLRKKCKELTTKENNRSVLSSIQYLMRKIRNAGDGPVSLDEK